MAKELSQITFEFVGESNPEEEQAAPVPTKPKSARGRKKLTDDGDIDVPEIPEDDILFQKQYYSIGEVAKMFKVNASLIRHWEKEFDIISPRKNRKGDRFFKPTDIKNLQMIHDLLRRRKFTIEGAREHLRKSRQVKEKHEIIQSLQRLKSFLIEMKASL